MKILAIETSCDDTGIAILDVRKDNSFKVLSNIVSSQIKVHAKYGGVYPVMAKREHQRNLAPVLQKALEKAMLLKVQKLEISSKKLEVLNKILEREPELAKKLISFFKKYRKPNIDLIAVTNGPGLEPCLWVGVNFAKAISYFWNIPIVDVNHIKAHIFVNMLGDKKIKELKQKDFPALCLVVSGGHTQLFLMRDLGKYEIIGETRDDAAGECFDKCAKILDLGYPGGPIISKLAQKSDRSPTPIKLPRPMINTKDYDFSFSGLKTAVLYADRKVKIKNAKYKKEMASEIQQAIIDVLIKKTLKAVKDFNVKTLILGGGVTANKELKKQFATAVKNLIIQRVELFVPPANLSTDNALMTAVAGYFRRNKKIAWQKLEANANLRVE